MKTPDRLLRFSFFKTIFLLFALWLPSAFSVRAQPYNAGDIVTTNLAFQNRLLWTNDNGQVFAPSNTLLRLSDFEGKIAFFMFFDVW